MSEIENNGNIELPKEAQVVPTPTKKRLRVSEVYKEKTAGFWIRFWAFALDTLVVAAVVGILVKPIFYIFDWSLDDTKWYAPIAIISGVVYYTYFVLMTKICSQTLGKMIFGLKVVQINGEKLTWLTVIFRELVCRFISNKIRIVYIIVAFMPKNQSLADLLSDTLVIQEKVYVKKEERVIEEVPVSELTNENSISPTV